MKNVNIDGNKKHHGFAEYVALISYGKKEPQLTLHPELSILSKGLKQIPTRKVLERETHSAHPVQQVILITLNKHT